MNGQKNKLKSINLLIFTVFFVSVTYLQHFFLDPLGGLSNYFFISVPILFIFIYILLLVNIKSSIKYINCFINYSSISFVIYLIISAISTILSPVADDLTILKGLGHIFIYFIVFISSILFSALNLQKFMINKYYLSHEDLIKAAFYASNILVLTFFIKLYFYEEFLAGRYEIFMKPASLGLLAVPAIAFILSFGLTFIRILIILLISVMLALTHSRTAILSILLSSVIILCLKYNKKIKLLTLLGAIVIIFLLLINLDFTEFMNAFEKIFLISDRYRGIDKLSGRVDIYYKLIDIFKQNPYLGIGFRLVDDYIGVSAHNFYLMSLAETGLIGTFFVLSCYVLFVYKLLVSYLKQNDKISLYYIYVSISLAIFGIGERFLFNTGNATSILLFYGLSYSTIANNMYCIKKYKQEN